MSENHLEVHHRNGNHNDNTPANLEVGRLTRKPARLEALCDLGYRETMARAAELREWLGTAPSG